MIDGSIYFVNDLMDVLKSSEKKSWQKIKYKSYLQRSSNRLNPFQKLKETQKKNLRSEIT